MNVAKLGKYRLFDIEDLTWMENCSLIRYLFLACLCISSFSHISIFFLPLAILRISKSLVSPTLPYFTYVTAYSANLSLFIRHRHFTYVTWQAAPEPGFHEASLTRYGCKLVYQITVCFLFTLVTVN